jgi:hypothetical protein
VDDAVLFKLSIRRTDSSPLMLDPVEELSGPVNGRLPRKSPFPSLT